MKPLMQKDQCEYSLEEQIDGEKILLVEMSQKAYGRRTSTVVL